MHNTIMLAIKKEIEIKNVSLRIWITLYQSSVYDTRAEGNCCYENSFPFQCSNIHTLSAFEKITLSKNSPPKLFFYVDDLHLDSSTFGNIGD